MTTAISVAARDGAKAVICASTGNTGVRGGIRDQGRHGLRRPVPDGKIAMGKLSQAIAHGATLLQVEGNFDDCPTPGPQARGVLPGRAGQLGQPGPDRGPEDGGLRDRRRARRRPGHPLPPGRERRQYHRVLEGLRRVGRLRAEPAGPGDAPCRRCTASRPRGCPDRPRLPRSTTRDGRHGDPDRQPGVLAAGRRRPGPLRRAHRHGQRRGDPRRASAAVQPRGRLRRTWFGRLGRRAAQGPRGRPGPLPDAELSVP